MSDQPICPCEGFEHPAAPQNLPGLPAVQYRAGDFRTFRHALLIPLEGETELAAWRPNARGDLALQMVEWCAYLADILTFYTERFTNEALLGTATQPESVRRLIRLLGYRPRPGIAAKGVVAGLLSGPKPVSLPKGFAIQSKPGPGKEPQTFELDADVTFTKPDSVPALPEELLIGPGGTLFLEGTVNGVIPGDKVVLHHHGWPTPPAYGQLLIVQQVTNGKDTLGRPYTQLSFVSPALAPVGTTAQQCRLVKAKQSSPMWQKSTTYAIMTSPADLAGIVTLTMNDPIVFHAPGVAGLVPALRAVAHTDQDIFYLNAPDPNSPHTPPDINTTIPIPAPHTRVGFTPALPGPWNQNATNVRLLHDFQPVGKLRNAPSGGFTGSPATLHAMGSAVFRTGSALPILLEDKEGTGVAATGAVLASKPAELEIGAFDTPPPAMKTPLSVLHNLVAVSRGQSVGPEILGSGDATQAGQEFILKKSPLTYVAAGDGYRSTLRLYVDGVEWKEVASFYGQPPDARIFVTREDADQKTHVHTGDGVNGARLSSGTNNVVGWYRFGSGFDAPAAGQLTVVAKPMPGLKGFRSPVAPGGGADPDPPGQIRRYAPRSVLTFGRAIAADDYEAIAASAPGVTRAGSYFAWNAAEQRATVTIYVGDDIAAVTSAREALLLSSDPNRHFSVVPAMPVFTLALMFVRIAPDRIAADVVAAVRSELSDPDSGLLGKNRVTIGQRLYHSEVVEACMRAPGVVSVPIFLFIFLRQSGATVWFDARFQAAPGEFFAIRPEWVFVFTQVAQDAG